MQTPSLDASAAKYVVFGRYVARRLKRQHMEELASSAVKATQAVKSAGRSAEDAAEPVADALALRDGINDDFDDAAKALRNGLAGRGVDAMTLPPYSDIFHSRIEYYTAAPLEDNQTRMSELREHVQTRLPGTDSLRQEHLPAIDAAANGWRPAVEALEQAERIQATAGLELVRAKQAFNRQMERIWAALVDQHGRAGADRFFPRRNPRVPKSEST